MLISQLDIDCRTLHLQIYTSMPLLPGHVIIGDDVGFGVMRVEIAWYAAIHVFFLILCSYYVIIYISTEIENKIRCSLVG